MIVKPADVDEYEIAAYCPVCEQRVDDREGVHEVPAGVVDVSVQDVAADGGGGVPFMGFEVPDEAINGTVSPGNIFRFGP